MLNKNELDELITVGETVNIQTSAYSHTGTNVPLYPPTWKPAHFANPAAVRALLASGRYTGETFWRGATITKIA